MNKVIIRKPIKSERKKYYVEYQPADQRNWLAQLQLIYIDAYVDISEIKNNLEEEFNDWVAMYPIPLMATAFDCAGNVINLSIENSSLCGYKDLNTGRITIEWGCLQNKDFPEEQKNSEYQKDIYKDIPFEIFDREKVKEEFIRKAKKEKKIIYIYGIGLILFPIVIEIIAMGINWFNWLIIIIGWLASLYKILKFLDYIKPSKHEEEKNKINQKKDHYFYHCERNPKAFDLLRSENFEMDAIESIKKEYQELKSN
jgi:hypothetical protein